MLIKFTGCITNKSEYLEESLIFFMLGKNDEPNRTYIGYSTDRDNAIGITGAIDENINRLHNPQCFIRFVLINNDGVVYLLREQIARLFAYPESNMTHIEFKIDSTKGMQVVGAADDIYSIVAKDIH